MRPKIALPLLLVLSLLTMSAGQDPAPPNPLPDKAKVVLTGPTKAKVGELVVLDATKSIAQDFQWIVTPETKNYLVIDDETRLVFSSPTPGTYTFFVSVAYEGTVASQVYTVTILSPPTELSAKVEGWVQSLPPSETRSAEAARLAGSFETIASLVDAGSFPTPQDVLTATKQANQDALGPAKEAWTPFFVSLQSELVQLANSGRLTDANSHAPVWREIAGGLRAN